MTSPARLNEFATGAARGVLVERKAAGSHLVHVDPSCEKVGKYRVGLYATEKTARAAVAGVKPCKHCRTSN